MLFCHPARFMAGALLGMYSRLWQMMQRPVVRSRPGASLSCIASAPAAAHSSALAPASAGAVSSAAARLRAPLMRPPGSRSARCCRGNRKGWESVCRAASRRCGCAPHRHVQGTGPRGVEVEAELAPREASQVTLQRRVTPALPAVGGHLHRLDAGAAVPRLAAELHPLPAPQARTRDVAGDE